MISQLAKINRDFYRQQAGEFASTRRRIQPGVRRTLEGLPDLPGETWLDLGCGSAWLAVEWLRKGRQSRLTGLDDSEDLLREARSQIQGMEGAERVSFQQADLLSPDWAGGLQRRAYHGAFCFAVLHHLPGAQNRLRFLQTAKELLLPGRCLCISVWQFFLEEKWAQRQMDWTLAGIDPQELEEGDTLLDWRHTQGEAPALRYVHRFNAEEIRDLGEKAGFKLRDRFEMDGKNQRMGCYWVFEA